MPAKLRPSAPGLALSAAALLAACSSQAPTSEPAPATARAPEATPPPGPERVRVTDLPGFERFIAGKPSVDAFRAAYPGLQLVLPGDFTTRELRGDNSRYFAELDAERRIVGGSFQ